ncbi:hypothetical protein [Stenotrophomonas phage IME-SM1]|uniref:Uncharacterized protein n=1 Tax=Stenotrophomonas phage IME-SM1 TaxID=1654717 RepID=A0A0H4ITK7_9CAUD|nr:hypothetical protein KMC40_gp119 [Stenotrophomonas phage IME-SM1]AKO61639.1 hypothetical protein [Stenotrophomonas phage IME-SM1]
MDKTKIREELELIEVIMLGYQQCPARDDVLRGLKVIRREVFEGEMPRAEPYKPAGVRSSSCTLACTMCSASRSPS